MWFILERFVIVGVITGVSVTTELINMQLFILELIVDELVKDLLHCIELLVSLDDKLVIILFNHLPFGLHSLF